jgi:hypothetical protein
MRKVKCPNCGKKEATIVSVLGERNTHCMNCNKFVRCKQ